MRGDFFLDLIDICYIIIVIVIIIVVDFAHSGKELTFDSIRMTRRRRIKEY